MSPFKVASGTSAYYIGSTGKLLFVTRRGQFGLGHASDIPMDAKAFFGVLDDYEM